MFGFSYGQPNLTLTEEHYRTRLANLANQLHGSSNSGNGTNHSRNRTSHSASRTSNSRSQTPNPGNRTYNLSRGVRSSHSSGLSSNSGTNFNSENHALNLGYGTHHLGNRTSHSASRTSNSRSQTPNPENRTNSSRRGNRSSHSHGASNNSGPNRRSKGAVPKLCPAPTNPNGVPRKHYFGFRKLLNMLTQSPSDIIVELLREKLNFIEFLESDKFTPDSIVLVFEVLNVMIDSAFHENLAYLLLIIAREKVMSKIKNFILQLPLETNGKNSKCTRFWENPEKFFENLRKVFNAMVDIIAATAVDIMPELIEVVIYTVEGLEKRNKLTLSDDNKNANEHLLMKVKELMTKQEERKKVKREDDQLGEPPEDFRDIDVYPSCAEICSTDKIYLRKNIVDGAYRDPEHYLDVQFRLVREDFVRPLKMAITEYIEGTTGRISNIKIFKDALCLGNIIIKGQTGYQMRVFKPGSIRNIENGRRFIYGSLVCLTKDNFQSMLFGRIIDSNIEHLKQGIVTIELEGTNNNIAYKDVFVFIEYGIFFEPYYQVLNALKSMNPETFPFENYLVYVKDISNVPLYMRQNPLLHQLDLCKMNLNDSQVKAFNAAFTQEFCIIQGPPGTGKTFLGLQIANTLINCSSLWNRSGPMLIICYTNHALDQFLEGILKSTSEVIRVGGRSQNENLNQYNLRNCRRVNTVSCTRALRDKKNEVDQSHRAMESMVTIYTKISNYKCVVDFNLFSTHLENFRNCPLAQCGSKRCKSWLLDSPNYPREYREDVFQFLKQKMSKKEVREYMDEYDDHRENVIDLDDDIPTPDLGPNGLIWYDLDAMGVELNKKISILEQMEAIKENESQEYMALLRETERMERDLDYITKSLDHFKTLNENGSLTQVPRNINNPWDLAPIQRWALYDLWSRQVKRYLFEECQRLYTVYRHIFAQYTELRDMADLSVLRSKKVIGMTTTGAARLHKSLQSLNCPIVIVEEAAEVLEAHVVTALSKACQHLILIGDHEQLKPATADFTMTKYYNLGVSLFERMVTNGYHCYSLDVQHRMRPEISNLVSPSIYPDLKNHESVLSYPKINGVVRPLFFIDHAHPERAQNDGSKENEFEATYLINLARYLCLNGYEASQITLLATYSAQFFLIRKLKKFDTLKNLRVCVLDNYQGEENDIILLSLVRNNEDNNIGFLKLKNRVCVALSRAKQGFYIMGNIEMLCANSPLWTEIREVLVKHEALGKALQLQCVRHPEEITSIQNIADFELVPEGGCMNMCEESLPCGHKCPKLCHSSSHDSFKCRLNCTRIICDLNHTCPKLCYEICDKCMVPKKCVLPCGHEYDIPCYMEPHEYKCLRPMKVTLEDCGHEVIKPCHIDVGEFRCTHHCETRVEPCGHACRRSCHVKNDPDHLNYNCMKQCARSNAGCSMSETEWHPCRLYCHEKCRPCDIIVNKKRSCGHFITDAKCSEDVELRKCLKMCKRELPCGHPCRNNCFENCGPCMVKVKKVIDECGHSLPKVPCGIPLTRSQCKSAKCHNKLPCGHACPFPCRKDCSTAVCEVLIDCCWVDSPCGHKLQVPCYARNQEITPKLMSYCKEPCTTKLKCDHTCGGTCGECVQGRFHKECVADCKKILICGHACETPCAQGCLPCKRQCSFKCVHTKCKKPCGVPCTDCAEKCQRRCEHQHCTAKCSKPCTVDPCDEPCPELLACGHPCIGFCGEVCPPLCRVCDSDEVTELFLGFEDEEDARYVYLESCKHTIESTGLNGWFASCVNNGREDTEVGTDSKAISMLVCPKCKTPVSSLRFSEHIKLITKDLTYIKRKFFGDFKENCNQQKQLKRKLKDLPHIDNVKSYAQKIDNWLTMETYKQKRNYLSKPELISIKNKIQLLEEMLQIRYEKQLVDQKSVAIANDYLNLLLKKLIANKGALSDQRIEDFQWEIQRFSRIMQFCEIVNKFNWLTTFPIYEECKKTIAACDKSRYTPQNDMIIKEKLVKLNETANGGLRISDRERREILGAVGLSSGHWFKCINNHIYCIGECGGAMEMAKCPECNETIGGGSHRLAANNRLATEMDGARAPAYPSMH